MHSPHSGSVLAHLLVIEAGLFAAAALQCKFLEAAHGLWTGGVQVGGNYTLTCHDGFEVDESATASFSMSCPTSGAWTVIPKCIEIDDCKKLKHGCGPLGICNDLIRGYKCVCEDGYQVVTADDGSGEPVCGKLHSGVCGGNTCGARGICVDLEKAALSFDSGRVQQEVRSGKDTYRCACASGWRDNGVTCVPEDCGRLEDSFGTWHGSSVVGGRYTLTCNKGSYVMGGSLTELTIECSHHARWTFIPECEDLAQEARDAAAATYRFWLNCALSVCCVVCAALAAGLTMGLVSLEPFDMQVLMHTREQDCNTEEERADLLERQAHANRLHPVLSDHHLLLVTLLLMNSVANEALPIFLDEVVPTAVAVLLSVTAVLIFGEILPSAIFTGPSQLRIASLFAPLVRILEVLFAVVAIPIARILDHLLPGEHEGDGGGHYNRAELRALILLHGPPPGQDTHSSLGAGVISSDDELQPLNRFSISAESNAEVPKKEVPSQDPSVLNFDELAVIQAVFAFKETPISECLVLRNIDSRRIVSVEQDIASLREACIKVSFPWLLAVKGDTKQELLSKKDIVGIFSPIELPTTGVEKLKELNDDFFQTPIWIKAESTALQVLKLLSIVSSNDPGCIAIGIVHGISDKDSWNPQAILGSVAVGDLGTAMMLGESGVRGPGVSCLSMSTNAGSSNSPYRVVGNV